jgi:divalent metal cation (Fe/Co/Zn/Cd) transporter
LRALVSWRTLHSVSRFLEFHLLVPGATRVADAHALCDRIEMAPIEQLPHSHVTIHIEPSETQLEHP